MTKKTKRILCVEPGTGTMTSEVMIDGAGNMRGVASIAMTAEGLADAPAVRLVPESDGTLRVLCADGTSVNVNDLVTRVSTLEAALAGILASIAKANAT